MEHTADGCAPTNTHLHRWALLAGLLAGFFLRLYQLGGESFWYDETVSVFVARQPLAAMLAHTAGDIHPPGYYLLLHLWQLISRPTLDHGLEFLFAWPSLWWGMVILPLLYVLGKQLFSPRVGLMALWLAAANPFQLWYSQEVRMYTLGAALGLLCLWAMLQYFTQGRRARWLAVYVVSAAAGLYTLYYFLLVLVALNLAALLWFWRHRHKADGPGRQLLLWLAAQGAMLLLWLPWLPIFWRQMTDPPVPPWRTPWRDVGAFSASVAETLAAPLVGQSPPGEFNWPWAILGALLIGAAVALTFTVYRQKNDLHKRASTWLLLIYMFVPVALLYAATAILTPVYHVRYLFIYLSPFPILVGAIVEAAAVRWRWLAGGLFAGLFALSFVSLRAMWSSPLYRADDHRGAVAQIARDWRPGDAILANAGWIYTILDTYWPTDGVSLDGSDPPGLDHTGRINDYANNTPVAPLALPFVVRTGTVDGDESLGWGNPGADFFAVSAAETTSALTTLAANQRRIWQYRLYDTVSDPEGVIRNWLAAATTPLLERPIPGRDFGLVQLFTTGNDQASAATAADEVAFGNALQLHGHTLPVSTTAGSPLYVDLHWEGLPALAALPVDLSMSLRLYDAAGAMIAQADGPPLPATSTWPPGAPVTQAAALPVPAATAPGAYTVELIVYRQDDGIPLPLVDRPRTVDGQRWMLGTVVVEAAPESRR